MNGVINVYKERGYTSFDVVARLRGILKQKKIGHTGTLDPDAEGVLPVCIGQATKLCEFLTEKKKEYEAWMHLGITTDTQDMTGVVLTQKEVVLSEEEVKKTVDSFLGSYSQVPPMYSALKVNGQKLCDLARRGIEVERKARAVTIYSIEIPEIKLPLVKLRVECSKGTYIRTLCQDIGDKLGCGACMESLLRTAAAGFFVEHSHTLAQIEQAALEEKEGRKSLERLLIPVDQVLCAYPAVYGKAEAEKLLENGNRIPKALMENPPEETEAANREAPLRMYQADGRFVGLYQYDKKREDYKPLKIFCQV